VTALAAPSVLALAAVGLAALVHPGVGAAAWLPWHDVWVTSVALLLFLALVARARAGAVADRLVAVGALLVLAALGSDAVRGRRGVVLLAPVGGVRSFTETGPGGRPLGLRPLGFVLRLEEVTEAGGARLAVGQEGGNGRFEVAPDRSAAWGGYRFGRPRTFAAADTFSLRLRVAGPQATRELTLAGDAAARVGDLDVSVEQFFPDFELDERRQPRSRSDEPNNPAALLQVRRGDRAWRVFVIQRFPDLHRQDGLPETFSLVGVESGRDLSLDVASQPAASLAAAGLALAALGVVLGSRRS
jgi:hypothetical protein